MVTKTHSPEVPPFDQDLDRPWFGTGMAGWTPSESIGMYLTEIDANELGPEERVALLQTRQRLSSHVAAQVFRDTASIVDSYAVEYSSDVDDPEVAKAAAHEIRAALHMTRRSADHHVVLALRLREVLPQLLRLLESGEIDMQRVRAIDDATIHLDDDTARAVVSAIAGDAHRLTTGQLRARIRKLALDLEPKAAELDYQRAIEQRSIAYYPTPHGTASVEATNMPPDRVSEISRRIDHIARSLRRNGETRTMEQLRVDVFLDILTGTSHDRIGRGVVDIRVDLETLTGLASRSGDLGGYGPVIADIARQTAEQNPKAEFRFAVTDPTTREVVSLGTTRRRPTAEQRRIVEMFHLRCVFPGCRMPANQCDIDHRIEHVNGGPTAVANLAPLCEHDHQMRHDKGWTYSTNPETGEIGWTSPLGVTYHQPPHPDQIGLVSRERMTVEPPGFSKPNEPAPAPATHGLAPTSDGTRAPP